LTGVRLALDAGAQDGPGFRISGLEYILYRICPTAQNVVIILKEEKMTCGKHIRFWVQG